jgi:hypothetical protein
MKEVRMIKTLLGIAGAGWLVWQWQKSRAGRDTVALGSHAPRALTDWESEGGALPDTGPQLTSTAAPDDAPSSRPAMPAQQPV